MDSRKNILSSYDNLTNSGMLESLEDLRRKNAQLERLICDMAVIATANSDDKLLDFVIDKTLSTLVPKNFTLILSYNNTDAPVQYFYKALKKEGSPFSSENFLSIQSYFSKSAVNGQKVIALNSLGDSFDSSTAATLESEGVVSLLPLFAQENLFGVALFSNKITGDSFTSDEVFYIEHLYTILSLALQNKINYHSAITDGKTGLYTYPYFTQKLGEKLDSVKKYGESHALLMFDVDHFKDFNDNFGHIAGDEALNLLAKILLKSVRNDDVVCRFGGEEFLVLLSCVHPSCLFTVAERIRQNIEKATFPYDTPRGKELLHITASIGGCIIDSSTVMDASQLLQFVDSALYRSKTNGRNCTTIL